MHHEADAESMMSDQIMMMDGDYVVNQSRVLIKQEK